jgi:hypothetical protein
MNAPQEWHAVSPDYLTSEPTIRYPSFGYQVARPILPEPSVVMLAVMALILAMSRRVVVLGLALVLLLPSCITSQRVPVATVTPTYTSPIASQVHNGVSSVTDGNDKIRQQNQTLKQAADEARRQADTAAKEADALAHVGKATQDQLTELAKSMRATQVRNLFLESQISIQDQNIAAQTEKIKALTDTASNLTRIAAEADTKAQTAQANYSALENDYKAVVKDRDLFRSKYDAAAVYEHWVWAALGILVVYLGLRVAKLTPWGKIWLFWLP